MADYSIDDILAELDAKRAVLHPPIILQLIRTTAIYRQGTAI